MIVWRSGWVEIVQHKYHYLGVYFVHELCIRSFLFLSLSRAHHLQFISLQSIHTNTNVINSNIQYIIQAYNVALTRFQEVWVPSRAKLIAPMADMLNHSAEPNCEITFDDMGNCQVTAMYDIPAGMPLTISYGDPTNPTPIFAQFGFLPADCTTLFCKAMHLESYIKELGIDFKDLLIQVETGEIAPKVRYICMTVLM